MIYSGGWAAGQHIVYQKRHQSGNDKKLRKMNVEETFARECKKE
jgi:hypothetical protein